MFDQLCTEYYQTSFYIGEPPLEGQKEEIYKDFNDKINEIINMINIEEIRKSICFSNQEIINGLQPENINSLLIICKSMKLENDINIKNKLIQKPNIPTFLPYIFLIISPKEKDY